MRLQNIGCIHDISELFHKHNLFKQDIDVWACQLSQLRSPVKVSEMALRGLHDVQPALMLSPEKLLEGQCIHFRTVYHLTMNEAHCL